MTAACAYVAQRIIGKLQEGAAIGRIAVWLGIAIAGDARSRPPTPAMKRFADSIARQKGVKPPPGDATMGSICRAFLNQHAPKKADAGIPGASGSKPASPAQILFAEKLAQENGIVIPDEAKATSAAISTWIDSNQVKKRGKSCRKRVNTPTQSIAPKSAVQRKRSRKRAANVVATATPSTPARGNSGTDTPLRIPYGNKDAALRLDAAIEQAGGMPPRASILLPSANAGGYRAKRRGRVEQASSWRCVRRERPASASFRAKPDPRVCAVRAAT